MMSRRDLVRLLVAGCIPALRAYTDFDRLCAEYAGAALQPFSRRYRVDAFVTLLSLPIVTRRSAGGAYATIQEARKDDRTGILLQFAAGSLPERVRGLNRLGFIQELIVEQNCEPVEAACFGFITSSKERSFDEARKALSSSDAGLAYYSAVRSSAAPGRFRAQLHRMKLPNSLAWLDCAEICGKVKSVVSCQKPTSERVGDAGSAPRTFLYSVWRAMREAIPKSDDAFLHNGHQYLLQTQIVADEKIGRELIQLGLANRADRVMRLTGRIQEPASREKSAFQLWFEQDTPYRIPLRIEFRAMPFLRLTLEYQPGADGPPIEHLLHKEKA